jgi:hypothetical protein
VTVDLRHADCLDVLRTLPVDSASAIVTDPPYGLAGHRPATVTAVITAWCSGDREHVPLGNGFMSRSWDAFVPPPAVWDECIRVLKPGGHLLCFAAPRTMDLMGISIRLAGFEMRDAIGNALLAWVQGQGFPKGKAQLKPAWEPIIVARKAAPGPWLNIDGTERATGGRWPANVVLTHAPDCADPCAPGCPVAELDTQSGTLKSGAKMTVGEQRTDRVEYRMPGGLGYGDSGGGSRFFPTFRYQAKAPTSERPKIDGKGWPTVKPLALMRWLVRLVTPPGGLVLDPFAGTGPTLQAAELEGFDSLGIEKDEFAYRLACQRLRLTPGGDSDDG